MAATRQPWFERRFTFDLPPDNRHDVIARLLGTPLRLRELCRGLPRARATAHRDGAWSIQQNAGHLLDLEPLGDGRLDDYLADRPTLRAADLQNTRTHDARHDEADLAALLDHFAAARSAWVARLRSLSTADFARTAIHPRLQQPMRLVDLCGFVAAHDDHHLGRILELLGPA